MLVAAPTGSGKTVVAEFALERALRTGGRLSTRRPLKALSNQKFGDFVGRYGAATSVCSRGTTPSTREAPIVVMTTEVLRNMLYEDSPTLDGLETVAMDEVHYLQDPYRGAVWEEVLIHLPLSVAVVCLSATVSNAEEFGEWIGALRGPTRVVIEERRPVPLRELYMVGRELHAMHVEHQGHPMPNPFLVSLDQRELRVKSSAGGRTGGASSRQSRPREGHRRVYVPRREDVVEVLAEEGMLPAIYFVFSRAGCDKSVRFLMDAGLRLTTPDEEATILERADARTAWIDDEELVALGYYELREALAWGSPPTTRACCRCSRRRSRSCSRRVSSRWCSPRRPCRWGSTCRRRLWSSRTCGSSRASGTSCSRPASTRSSPAGQDDGDRRDRVRRRAVPVPGAVRAGGRSGLDPDLRARSSFRPSYNMAVNLVRNYTREEARHLLNSSFGQFLADRGVVMLERQLERDRAYLDGYVKSMACDRGDFGEYWRLKERAARVRQEGRRGGQRDQEQRIRDALVTLRPGDVVILPSERRRGRAVVLGSREGRPTVLTEDRRYFRLNVMDLRDAPVPVARIELPGRGAPAAPGTGATSPPSW